jgi:urease subunit alpha
MVLKGGVVAWSAMGEGNASVHGAEPTRYGPDWGGLGAAAARTSVTFVSQAALDAGFAATTGRRVVAVHGTRGLTRDALIANRATPTDMTISPDDGTVAVGGRVLAVEPTVVVPLSRRYLLA